MIGTPRPSVSGGLRTVRAFYWPGVLFVWISACVRLLILPQVGGRGDSFLLFHLKMLFGFLTYISDEVFDLVFSLSCGSCLLGDEYLWVTHLRGFLVMCLFLLLRGMGGRELDNHPGLSREFR